MRLKKTFSNTGTWAQEEFKGEDIDRLRFEVDSAIINLNRYINAEFKRKAMGKARMRTK